MTAAGVGCSATLLALGAGSGPAHADVTAVTGSAFGVSSSVSLFGGPNRVFAPAPSVTLPPGGSTTPVTGSAQSEDDVVGPAHLFTSGPISVSTVGSPPSTSVMSSVTVNPCTTAVSNSCSAGQIYNGPFTTTGTISATCSATGTSAPTATVTINGGQLASGQSPNTTMMAVPTHPAPDTVFTGIEPDTGQMYKYEFNEQITNADGSLSVNAVHEFLRAGTTGAQGDLFIGQVVCGATASAATTTTTAPGGSTTTAAGATTTTTASPTTTAAGTTTTSTTAASMTSTTAAATTTTTLPVINVGGSAFGYYSIVSLFGGPSAVRGPTPSVTLPSGGSASPVTDHADTGAAIYGPAHIFESGPISVSTQGQSGTSGSVTSSTSIQGCTTADPSGAGNGCHTGEVFGGPFTAASVASKCTAGASGVTGSTTIANGMVVTLDDASGKPVTTVPLPDPIPANFAVTGTITEVNGGFKWVFNEQTTNASGSLTVNAAHEYLGFSGSGPAKGDLILGQSVCAKALSATTGSGPGSSGGLATTGGSLRSLLRLALVLLLVGCAALGGARQDELELPSSTE